MQYQLPQASLTALGLLRVAKENHAVEPELVETILLNAWDRVARYLLKDMNGLDNADLVAVSLLTEYFAEKGDWRTMYDKHIRSLASQCGIPREILHWHASKVNDDVKAFLKKTAGSKR
jgi:hypothetical protein